MRALKLYIDNLVVAGDQGWERLHVPGDGDYLFSSMALCKMVLDGIEIPPVDRRSTWGQLCRKHFLQHVTKRLTDGDGYLGAASLQVLIQTSTDMHPEQYLRRMQTADSSDRQTWGGFLEIAILCKRWQCMACIFRASDQGLSFLAYVGDKPRAGLAHKGVCAVAWWGAHYEALRLSDVMLACLLDDIAQSSA